MKTPRDLRTRVLGRIRPPAETTRRAEKAAKDLGEKIRRAAKEHGYAVTPCMVGSVAKRTHAEPLDVDLFILFDPKVPRATLEADGLALASRFLSRVEHRHSEHPYAHGRYGGLAFDVVPAYAITDRLGRKSAVDRTPLHTEYMKEHLPRKDRDEVRLLKQFFKGIGAYGAETAVGGFSGYLSELLVLAYGSFDGVVAAATHWPDRVTLSLHDEPTDLGGCFVFVDPVDRDRNAAAAVQPGKLALVRRAARAYVSKPTARFFFPRKQAEPGTEAVRRLLEDTALTGLQVPQPRTKAQAERPHLERVLGKVVRLLTAAGFEVSRRGVVEADGAYFLAWDTRPHELPATVRHRGPPAHDASNAMRFRQKWAGHPGAKGPIVEDDGRLWIEVEVTERTSAKVVQAAWDRVVSGTKWTAADVGSIRWLVGGDWVRSARRRLAAWRVVADVDPWDV